MNPISSLILGKNLMKLTDVFEIVEKEKQAYFDDAGGKDFFDSLKFKELEIETEHRLNKLKKYPPYEITKATLGNLMLNEKANDQLRVSALNSLLEHLIAEGIALNVDEFDSAYFGAR